MILDIFSPPSEKIAAQKRNTEMVINGCAIGSGVSDLQEANALITPAMLVLTFDTTGLADGAYGTSVTIHTSDENLPGAGQTALALSLMALVGDAALCEADLNSDDVVDVSDLLVLLGGWGSCPRSGECEADLNGDAVVDVSDLLILLGEWGQCSFID